MEASQTIQCPFCGQSFELIVDTDPPDQRFTTDCEICCRPMEVFLQCEDGEVQSIDVRGE